MSNGATVTETEVLSAVASLCPEEQIAWMLQLGAALTVTARDYYPFEEKAGSIQGLIGINEIQHRVFARVRDLTAGHEWTIESFVSMVIETASTYGISGNVGWVLKRSLPERNTANLPN